MSKSHCKPAWQLFWIFFSKWRIFSPPSLWLQQKMWAKVCTCDTDGSGGDFGVAHSVGTLSFRRHLLLRVWTQMFTGFHHLVVTFLLSLNLSFTASQWTTYIELFKSITQDRFNLRECEVGTDDQCNAESYLTATDVQMKVIYMRIGS